MKKNNIKDVFGNYLFNEVVQQILSGSIYAFLNGSIEEDENKDLVGNYSFLILIPDTNCIKCVSPIIKILLDFTNSDSIKTIEELKSFIEIERERQIFEEMDCERTIPMYGYGYDVVGHFISRFSEKLYKLGVIPESMVIPFSSSSFRGVGF